MTSRRWSTCACLLELEAVKLCARNRTPEDLENIEQALIECEEKFYTDERVSRRTSLTQALARGAHNPVIASMLLVITPDVALLPALPRLHGPAEEVCFEHRELLRCVRERDEGGRRHACRRHLKSRERVRRHVQRRKSFSGIALRAGDERPLFGAAVRRDAPRLCVRILYPHSHLRSISGISISRQLTEASSSRPFVVSE